MAVMITVKNLGRFRRSFRSWKSGSRREPGRRRRRTGCPPPTICDRRLRCLCTADIRRRDPT